MLGVLIFHGSNNIFGGSNLTLGALIFGGSNLIFDALIYGGSNLIFGGPNLIFRGLIFQSRWLQLQPLIFSIIFSSSTSPTNRAQLSKKKGKHI